MGLQQATVANKLAAERLDAAQEALDLERYDDVLADALGDVLLGGFARAAQAHTTTAIPGVPDDVVLGGWL
jgi:nitrogenase subunit NifH